MAVLNTDDGAGEPRGWHVEGRDDVGAAMKSLAPLLAGLGGGDLSPEMSVNTDHAPFAFRGVPAMNLWMDTSHYMEIHHQAGDTVEKVAPHPLAARAAIVAETAWALAEQRERLAPRLDRAGVEGLLRKAGLYEALREVGRVR